MILRFAILILGLRAGVDFLAIVAIQTVVLLGGMLLPALWVIVRELRCHTPFRSCRAARTMPHFSASVSISS